MKKNISIIICVVLIVALLSGCSSQKADLQQGMESESLPLKMDFNGHTVTLEGVNVAELSTADGYTDVLDFKLTVDGIEESDMNWFIKEDLGGNYAITDEENDININISYGKGRASDEQDPYISVYGNILYYSHNVQEKQRYSLEGAALMITCSGENAEGKNAKYVYNTTITSNIMTKISEDGTIDAGSEAEKYMKDKETITNG